MANFDFSNVTLNPKEVTELSQAVFETAFTNPALTKMHKIHTGIDMTTQILLFGKMGLVGKGLGDNCAVSDDTAPIVATQKYWENNKIGVRLAHCKDDLPALLKAFGQKQNKYDVTGSDEVKVLADGLLEGLDESIYRMAWFGDKQAKTIVSGGTFTNGTDLGYFNEVDGIWKQVFDGVTAGKIKRIVVAANTGTTYAAQELAAGAGLELLRKVYNGSDSRLKNSTDAKFIVTQSIFDNFMDKLEDSGLNAVGSLAINDGVMTYRGKEIIVAEFMDRLIDGYQDNGTKRNLPNRIVFSTPENLPIGTLDEGEFKSLNVWYENKDRKVYLENIFSLDAKVLEEYLITVAY